METAAPARPRLTSLPSRIRRPAWTAVPLLALLAGAACKDDPCDPPSELCDVAWARTLVRDDTAAEWTDGEAKKPVVLYVDRSQSMRGFLDPRYPARMRTDYQSVLDGLDARLRPAQVFGFGTEVRAAEEKGLGVLGDETFYDEGNTELEEVLSRVREDSSLGSTHVVIGDGRRGDPDDANGQFVMMRGVAERWVEKGGTFIVAASAAPFRPVQSDAAGCRPPDAAAGRTCPLYAFAFVAPGDEGGVAGALAGVFDHLYVIPLPAVPEASVRMRSSGTTYITLESAWATALDGTPIVRARGRAATNAPMSASLQLRDTLSPGGRAALLATRGRRLVPFLSVRMLSGDTAPSAWRPSPGAGALMRPAGNPFTYEFFSRGADPDVPRYLYRLELRPAGEPSWLDAFTGDAGDAVRTHGLASLFEGFRALDPAGMPPVVRGFVVVN